MSHVDLCNWNGIQTHHNLVRKETFRLLKCCFQMRYFQNIIFIYLLFLCFLYTFFIVFIYLFLYILLLSLYLYYFYIYYFSRYIFWLKNPSIYITVPFNVTVKVNKSNRKLVNNLTFLTLCIYPKLFISNSYCENNYIKFFRKNRMNVYQLVI